MDKFLTELPHKRKAEDDPPNVLPNQYKAKNRKYDDAYLAFGFTCTTVGNEERPQCVVCLKVLACDSMKPNKLRRLKLTFFVEKSNSNVE